MFQECEIPGTLPHHADADIKVSVTENLAHNRILQLDACLEPLLECVALGVWLPVAIK